MKFLSKQRTQVIRDAAYALQSPHEILHIRFELTASVNKLVANEFKNCQRALGAL